MQPFQKPLKLAIALSLLLFSGSVLESRAQNEIALYDNLKEPPLPFDGRSIFSSTSLKAVLAQPFTTGEHGTICSVAFPVARLGSPSGIVPVEIWDDADGKPGKKVATVGEFDIATLKPVEEGGEILRFETEISGLKPHTKYYLLTDDTGTDVTGSNKTYLVQTAVENEGTGESGVLLGSANGGQSWIIVSNSIPQNDFRVMEILECPPSNQVALYDNLPDPLPQFIQGGGDGVGNAGPPGPSELQPMHAQPFLTNEWGTVDAVTVYIVGTPEVEGTIDLVVTKDAGGFPGETVSVLGAIDLETLTSWDQTPVLGDLITFKANLTGLEPNARYYVGFDISKMEPIDGRFPNATFFNLFRKEDQGTNSAGLNMAGPFGEWKPLSDFVTDANHMLMRITASQPATTVLTIVPSGDGSVSKEPDMIEYPVGTKVTVTATPEDGFEFVKWIYGDEEITTNPAILVIESGATLTPFFAPIVELKPLNVDIEPAVAISWDSQADKTYEIHSSPDLENWMMAVDDISGTGERLSYFFISGEIGVYYRVQEGL